VKIELQVISVLPNSTVIWRFICCVFDFITNQEMTRSVWTDPYGRRPEDYLFGRRIAEEKGKPSFQFRSTDKKVQDFTRINTGSGSLGPGTYDLPSSFNTRSFNAKSTFGEPQRRTPIRQCQLNEEQRYSAPPTHTEHTSNISEVDRHSWNKPKFNRKPSWGEPPLKAFKQTQLDGAAKQGLAEFTTSVASSFKIDKHPSPWGRRPQSSIKRDNFAPSRGATHTEFTTNVQSSLRIVPKRAFTPPTGHRGRLDLVPKHMHITQTEFTTTIPSTLNVSPVRKGKLPNPDYKKTDTWLRAGISRDSGPGPGQYFVP
jgi:hypothetical protein